MVNNNSFNASQIRAKGWSLIRFNVSLVTINLVYPTELVWKVARYTSAAPVFFAECDNYVDGGVKANNPTTFGLAEIQDFLSKKYG